MASLILLGVSFLSSVVSGATVPNAAVACKTIQSAVPDAVAYQSDSAFKTEAKLYWSQVHVDLVPACMVFPTTADHVSQIVKILGNYTDVPFAVKSGGHNPNQGFSSVDGGVLIAFSSLNATTYDASSKTAVVGTGSRWRDVIKTLDPSGVTVVGGRIGG
jgi:FAD/FMN-containing dehydrogenase